MFQFMVKFGYPEDFPEQYPEDFQEERSVFDPPDKLTCQDQTFPDFESNLIKMTEYW